MRQAGRCPGEVKSGANQEKRTDEESKGEWDRGHLRALGRVELESVQEALPWLRVVREGFGGHSILQPELGLSW